MPTRVAPTSVDLKQAVRRSRKRPGFSLLVIAVLGSGLGAASTIFSPRYAVSMHPLPLPEADRRVEIRTVSTRPGLFEALGVQPPVGGTFLAEEDLPGGGADEWARVVGVVGVESPPLVASLSAVLVLLGTALLASLLPAVRAARVDPLEALRDE